MSWNGSACRRKPGSRRARRGSNRYEELVNQKQDEQAADLEIYIPPGPRLGDVVVEAKGVSKAYRRQGAL